MVSLELGLCVHLNFQVLLEFVSTLCKLKLRLVYFRDHGSLRKEHRVLIEYGLLLESIWLFLIVKRQRNRFVSLFEVFCLSC